MGPEVPLSLGLADRLEACGRKVFGPVRECARLESSKAFSKQIMLEAGVPTAWAKIFDDAKSAQEALLKMEGPMVVKLDGLAAGKGVVVADTTAEASVALSRFSGASSAGRVLLEERLEGVETSLLCICDGERALPLMPAKDYKRALEGTGAKHRGHRGRLAVAFRGHAGGIRPGEAYCRANTENHGEKGHAIQRCALCRAYAHQGRPEGAGVQLSFRRPGNVGRLLPLMEDDLVEVMLEDIADPFALQL